MNLKAGIGVLALALISFYVLGFIGDPFLLVTAFPIILMCLLVGAFLVVVPITTGLISRFLPMDVRKKYENRQLRLKAIVSACLLFLVLGGLVANRYVLPGKFHPVSLLGDAGILSFAMFLGWNLMKSSRKSVLLGGTAVFVVFILVLAVAGSISITYDANESSSVEAVRSVPYLTWAPADKTINKVGVILWDKERSCAGINIYNPRNLTRAYLMDMSGTIVHTWSTAKDEGDSWHHIEMCENGDLFAIVKDEVLMRLDWDSNVKWVQRMRFHHDIAVADTGEIYVVARKDEVVFMFGLPVPVLNDYIVVLSPDGDVRREISLFKVLGRKLPFDRVPGIYSLIVDRGTRREIFERKAELDHVFRRGTLPDIFHDNTVEVIDRDISGLCKKGDLLISIKRLDLIGIIDADTEELVWSWGPGNLSMQHHPTLLENGNILIFDNGVERGYSRIVELDPLARKIVWEYKAIPPDEFFSYSRGGNQRLPNGNTLVTESDTGHVFEVTKEGDVVWEFYNTEIDERSKSRSTIYRMMRITDLEDFPSLAALM